MALTGKNTIITGAASGFGRETTLLFTERGANVVAVDIEPDGLEETADLVQEGGHPGAVYGVEADVTDAEAIDAVVETTVEEFGSIDIVFNNAGILHDLVPFEAIDESDWERTIDVNLKSVYMVIQSVLPHMRDQDGGAIVNMASIVGKRPRKNEAAYVASKAAVRMLSKELALEFAADGIRVNAINPVASNTGLLDMLPEEEVEQLAQEIPLGRLATPSDIAEAVAFLADDEKAGLITGAELDIDGGRGI